MELNDRTFWTIAQKVVNAFGVEAPAFASNQIEIAARNGDISSIKAWHYIADRIDQILDRKAAPHDVY